MSKNHFLLTAAFIISADALLAQDTANAKQLDEVVITATKYPVKQSQTGKVITVITKGELEKNTGKTLGQLLNQQAGLTINGALNSPGTNQTIYMRGAASGRTLILIDGIPAYDPSLINNEFDINLLSINDIQRIEVCRGAQSTLYGSDAIAGVINIITENKESTKPFHVSSTLAGGNLGTFKGNLQLSGKKNKLAYTLRYSKLLTDGFSSARDTLGSKGFDKDGYDGNIANAQAQYHVNNKLTIKGFFQYNQYKTDLDASAFTDDKDYSVNNKHMITGAGFQYKQDLLTITGNYQYSEIKRNYLDDSASIGGFAKYSKNDYYGKAQFIELYSSIKMGSGFTLLQGADYRYSSMNNQYLSISSFGPFVSGFRDTAMSQASLYTSLNYIGLQDKFSLEIGGRLNVHSRYGSNSTYTINPSFKITKNLRIFVSVATGFKAPSLYQLYDAYNGNKELRAEKSKNYEAGLDSRHDRISNRIVFFYRDIKNGIDYNNITFKYFNFFKQIARGLEYEGRMKPVAFLQLSANYTYLSMGETTQNRRVLNKDTLYKYSLRRPKHTVYFDADFQITPSFNLSANFKYVSDRHDVGGYRKADLLLDSYVLLGAHANYMLNKNVNFFADTQNLTGKKFFDANGYNSIPFVVTAGVRLKW